jgi:hypothetical protein
MEVDFLLCKQAQFQVHLTNLADFGIVIKHHGGIAQSVEQTAHIR